MNASEKTVSKPTRLISVAVLAVMIVPFSIVGCGNREKMERWHRDQFEHAETELRELADKGYCTDPLRVCQYKRYETPSYAKQRVLNAMDWGHIAFGTRGITRDKLDELEGQAEARIASQKLAYLKTWGVNSPADLELLKDVCWQMYAEKRTLPGGNPTETELKQLLPPTITKVPGCMWEEK